MSRVNLKPKVEGQEVVCGWDPPLNTYFIQVFKDPTDDESLITEFKDVWSHFEVVRLIVEHAEETPKRDRVISDILNGRDPGATASNTH